MRSARRRRACRKPTEAAVLEDAFLENLELFKAKPDAALKYVSHGEYPRDDQVRRQRAGGLHQCDEPDPESERSGDEGVAHGSAPGLWAACGPAAFSRASWHRHRHGRPGGTAALRSVRAERRRRTPAGGLPGLPHFAPKAKRVIYLFQSGAPSQLDLFDYKPQLAKTHGTDLPDSIRKGQRLTGDDRGADELSGRAVDLQVRAVRAIGCVAQRAAAPHREDRRRPVLHQVAAHRADQSRSGGDVRADRVSAGGPAEPGRVGLLWAGHDQPGPARLCRDDYRERPVAGRAAVGHGVPSEQVSGGQAAVGGRPGAVRLEPGGLRDIAARAVHRGPRAAEPVPVRCHSESRDRDADRAVRDGVPDADLGARAHRSVEGAGAHLRAVRPRFAESPGPTPRTA